MYWMRNNGGWNRSHGCLESVPRIDSFEAGTLDGWGVLFAESERKMLAFDCGHYIEYGPQEGQEIVEIVHPKELWENVLALTRLSSGFGGNRVFWLCPACGGRVRFLYQTGATFLCRKCAGLNYKSQQETKSDGMYYYRKGMALVEKRFAHWPLVRPDGFTFCNWMPDRPRYMHQTTYRRYLAQFLRYREKHSIRQIEDMQQILRIYGKGMKL